MTGLNRKFSKIKKKVRKVRKARKQLSKVRCKSGISLFLVLVFESLLNLGLVLGQSADMQTWRRVLGFFLSLDSRNWQAQNLHGTQNHYRRDPNPPGFCNSIVSTYGAKSSILQVFSFPDFFETELEIHANSTGFQFVWAARKLISKTTIRQMNQNRFIQAFIQTFITKSLVKWTKSSEVWKARSRQHSWRHT